MSILSDKLEFVAIMQAEYKLRTHWTVRLCQKLMNLGATASRIAVTMCNRELTKHEQRTWERLPERIEAALAEFDISPVNGFKLGGDPRGCTLKLILPSRRTNDWGREGICVPGA